MKVRVMLRYIFSILLFMALLGNTAFAQVTIGAGFAAMKYYGEGSDRPLAAGFNANLAIEFSPKTRLVLEPTFFFPVTYSNYQNINNIPSVKTNEQLKTVESAALFQFDLIGNNKGGAVIYIAAGPSLISYNANVTRENATQYNYVGNFNDYMLDARAGLEIPFLFIFKLYGEVEVEPKIASDFKNNSVSYAPNVGSVMAATIGLRLHI